MKIKYLCIFLILLISFSTLAYADIIPQDYNDIGLVDVYDYEMNNINYMHVLQNSVYNTETQLWENNYKTIYGFPVKKYMIEYNGEIVTVYRKMPLYAQSGERVYGVDELPSNVNYIMLINGKTVNRYTDSFKADSLYPYYTESGTPAFLYKLYDINGYPEIIFYTDELILPKYNVTLNPDSGYYISYGYWEGVEPIVISEQEANSMITLPECPYTKEGYVFDHWYDEYNKYLPGDEYRVPTRDVELRAVWKRAVTPEKSQYTITFDSNGGVGTMDSMLWYYDLFLSMPECEFEKEGHTFVCWTDGTNNYYAGDGAFIMPAHDVTLTAVWKKKSASSSTSSTDAPVIIPTPEKPPVKASPYNDIFNHWGRDQIEVITTKGLVDGITATEFKPDAPMTREMFVIALAKLSGVTSDYTNWAIDIGLLKGYGNGNYGLKDTITREQMAVFFERYMTLAKIDMESLKTVANTTFADDSSIADWSKSSVYTMQAMKLIQGKNNNIFDPQGLTTRAEAATVLYNLITVTGK